jgi:hypothetical protein
MLKTWKQRWTVLAPAAVLVVASLAFVQAQGILFPDWSKPAQGSYGAPAAEVGKASTAAQPWSVTTLASSIAGKPVKGEPISVVGEVVDLSCYLQVGKHGEKHRECGQKCARAGQPIGLVDEKGAVYTLVDEEHDPRRDAQTTLRTKLIDHMAHIVKVNGTLTNVDGQKTIFVQGSVQQ